jgi:hypothetical protein
MFLKFSTMALIHPSSQIVLKMVWELLHLSTEQSGSPDFLPHSADVWYRADFRSAVVLKKARTKLKRTLLTLSIAMPLMLPTFCWLSACYMPYPCVDNVRSIRQFSVSRSCSRILLALSSFILFCWHGAVGYTKLKTLILVQLPKLSYVECGQY